MSQLVNLLPIVGLVLIFWLLILRPAQKRQKEMRALQASLTPGDEVLLGSGLIGTLRSLDDDRAQIEVAPGVHVTVVRGSIAARTTATLDARASRDDAHVDQQRPTPASLSRATLRRTVRSTSSRHATHATHALKPRDTERPRR